MTTLEQIRGHADPTYPADLLVGCQTALLLFAGAFRGSNDGIHIADAFLTGTCVDHSGDGIEEMASTYPDSWTFVQEDAFEFAVTAAREGRVWDVLSIDPPTVLFDSCAEATDLWARLARKLIVLGSGHDTTISIPDGWRVVYVIQRSGFKGGVYWTVLEPSG